MLLNKQTKFLNEIQLEQKEIENKQNLNEKMEQLIRKKQNDNANNFSKNNFSPKPYRAVTFENPGITNLEVNNSKIQFDVQSNQNRNSNNSDVNDNNNNDNNNDYSNNYKYNNNDKYNNNHENNYCFSSHHCHLYHSYFLDYC